MRTIHYSLACIYQETLMRSPNLQRAAMPACPQHETDHQGRDLIASLPIHATENRP